MRSKLKKKSRQGCVKNINSFDQKTGYAMLQERLPP
jgi:hypothetical protein